MYFKELESDRIRAVWRQLVCTIDYVDEVRTK